jgi:hypothetical protein
MALHQEAQQSQEIVTRQADPRPDEVEPAGEAREGGLDLAGRVEPEAAVDALDLPDVGDRDPVLAAPGRTRPACTTPPARW